MRTVQEQINDLEIQIEKQQQYVDEAWEHMRSLKDALELIDNGISALKIEVKFLKDAVKAGG